MTLRFRAIVLAVASVFYLGACGGTFRPIATPIASGGGDPQVRRHAIVVSTMGSAVNAEDGATTHVNISGDTNAGQVLLGQDPVHATFIPGGSITFIANRALTSGKASVTSYSTFAQPTSPDLPFVTTLPDGSAPTYVFATATFVYVALSGLNTVGVLSPSVGIQGQVPVGTTPVAIAGPIGVAKIYVANQGSSNVTVINSTDNSVLTTVGVGTAPSFIVPSADGKYVYVLNRGSNNVSVIDTATDTVINTVAVGATPVFGVFDVKNLRVYIANSGASTITSINADPNQQPAGTPPCTTNCFLTTSTIPVGTAPVSIAPLADGSRIYVANSGSSSITVLSGLSLATQTTIAVTGLKPVSLASDADNTKVVVALQDPVAATATHADASAIASIRTTDNGFTTIAAPTAPGVCVNTTVPGWCRMKPLFVMVTP